MDVTILLPRLDLSFKEGPMFNERGPISPIRTHWFNFVKKLERKHHCNGDQVRIVELPMWQFTKEKVFDLATQSTIIYIPHRQKFEHIIDNGLYYMQTVFPEFFTIDANGWGAFLSYLPISTEEVQPNEELWNILKSRIKSNVSKFDQPIKSFLFEPEPYWTFICQIPHDQVILQSSNISVADALRKTIELAKQNNKKLFVKSHPVNPSSMEELKQITYENEPTSYWFDDISIHTILEGSEAVFLVNSGVGFEAMLHEKPIVTFGNSEYKNIVNQFDGKNTNINMSVNSYKKFVTAFFSKLYYSGDKDGEFWSSVTNSPSMGRHEIY